MTKNDSINKILELINENVTYDEAELGSIWNKEDLIDFVRESLLQVQKEAIHTAQIETLERMKSEYQPFNDNERMLFREYLVTLKQSLEREGKND